MAESFGKVRIFFDEGIIDGCQHGRHCLGCMNDSMPGGKCGCGWNTDGGLRDGFAELGGTLV